MKATRFNRLLLSSPQAIRLAFTIAVSLTFVGCQDDSRSDVDPDLLQGEPIQSATQIVAETESETPAESNPQPADSVSVPPLLAAADDDVSEPETTEPVSTEPVIIETEDGEFLRVGFDRLSGFEIEIGDDLLLPPEDAVEGEMPSANDQIPEPILGLNDTAIALKGFMLPLKVEGGLVTELLIMKDQSMCCFGVTPQIHEWVSVTMKDAGVKPLMDEAVTLYGTLKVGEIRENGYLVAIYSMEGVGMAEPSAE